MMRYGQMIGRLAGKLRAAKIVTMYKDKSCGRVRYWLRRGDYDDWRAYNKRHVGKGSRRLVARESGGEIRCGTTPRNLRSVWLVKRYGGT